MTDRTGRRTDDLPMPLLFWLLKSLRNPLVFQLLHMGLALTAALRINRPSHSKADLWFPDIV